MGLCSNISQAVTEDQSFEFPFRFGHALIHPVCTTQLNRQPFAQCTKGKSLEKQKQFKHFFKVRGLYENCYVVSLTCSFHHPGYWEAAEWLSRRFCQVD